MTPRIACAAAALLLCTACPKKATAPPERAAPLSEADALATFVRDLARQAELLLREQDEQIWKAWTEGVTADVEPLYATRATLFTPETIRKIERRRQLTTDATEVRALTYLQTHFVGEYLAQQLGDVNEAIANLEAGLTFSVNGKEHRYRDLERLLSNEPNASERRELYAAATPAVIRLTQLVKRREERIVNVLGELGYPSYEAFGAELRQVDLERVGLLAEEILQLTQAGYVSVMERLAQRELSVPLARVRVADVPRLFRPRGVDGLFPKEQVLPRATETIAGLGIDLGALKNLRLDTAERPGKSGRPLALAPKVPDDVRLSFVPAPGIRMQAMLFHELGHALALAHVQQPRFELAKLGGGAQAEALSHVFEDLVEDPVWLEEKAGLTGERLNAYLAATSAQKLFNVRRAAGRLLYQLELHRREGADARALYRAIMERTYGFKLEDAEVERYLVEGEDFFHSADQFRGWFLAAQIQGQLKARFGPRWWTQPDAAAFLKKLWAPGNALNAREVARSMGDDGVLPDVLLLRLGTTLNVPIRLNATVRETEPTSAPAPSPAPTPDAGTP